MPWEAFQDRRGQAYEINRETIYRILRSYARAEATYNNMSTKIETSFIGPDLFTVNINWAKVRESTDQRSKSLYEWFDRDSYDDMEQMTNNLRQMAGYTSWYNSEVTLRQADASRETMQNINRSVERGEMTLKGLEVVRDLSAEVLLIGATFLSGGWALAALGSGGAIKGAAKFQDTGKWEAGVFTASSEMLFGAFKLKAAASVASGVLTKSTETILTVLVIPKAKAALESTGKVLIEGKSVQTAIINGTLKATDPAILVLAKELARPNGAGGMTKLGALALVGAGAIKVVRDYGIKTITTKAGSPVVQSTTKLNRAIDSAIFDNDIIGQTAVRRRIFN